MTSNLVLRTNVYLIIMKINKNNIFYIERDYMWEDLKN